MEEKTLFKAVSSPSQKYLPRPSKKGMPTRSGIPFSCIAQHVYDVRPLSHPESFGKRREREGEENAFQSGFFSLAKYLPVLSTS